MSVRPELIPLLEYLARLTFEDLMRDSAPPAAAGRDVDAAGEIEDQAATVDPRAGNTQR